MKSNPKKYIFTEDLDYTKTPKTSIWGKGDRDTLVVLEKLVADKRIYGEWLHFAAGDGRYNNILLREADKVVATDIDKDALIKLRVSTPKKLTPKLFIQMQDITAVFPFRRQIFDGVFNTGTLHLFPQSIIDSIIQETSRVLKPGGLFIFDFGTDIKRINKDGQHMQRSDVVYTKHEAKKMLVTLLDKHRFQSRFIKGTVPPEKVTSGYGTYMFSCLYWLVVAKKFAI
ncbi:MAG: class I SAM-dependent methyltransferase [Patescibacteria group bacterium]